MMPAKDLLLSLDRVPRNHFYGRVTSVTGLLVEIGGVDQLLSIGARCALVSRDGRRIPCEVIGFRARRVLSMPFGSLEGVGLGCKA